MRKIGILTSGGDCQGLNAAIRGIGKSLYTRFGRDVVLYGIRDGYRGLIEGIFQPMAVGDFSGILTLGGTILGTSRQPYKSLCRAEKTGAQVVESMKKTYARLGLDCLVILGGNGTHKTANLLSKEGLNIVTLPKTIDNDIWGTDITFGFSSAVEIATHVIDCIHTTATSHSRVFIVEIMGHKVGWLTLYAGLAGGADAILIPEMPYDIKEVAKVVEKRAEANKNFTIIAVAEGAMDVEEARLKRKEREARRQASGHTFVATKVAKELQEVIDVEARTVIPGHILRGGTPCAYDRVLSTQFGVHAAQLISNGTYGVTVALDGERIIHNSLSDVAGVAKPVTPSHYMVKTARSMGISFCESDD